MVTARGIKLRRYYELLVMLGAFVVILMCCVAYVEACLPHVCSKDDIKCGSYCQRHGCNEKKGGGTGGSGGGAGGEGNGGGGKGDSGGGSGGGNATGGNVGDKPPHSDTDTPISTLEPPRPPGTTSKPILRCNICTTKEKSCNTSRECYKFSDTYVINKRMHAGHLLPRNYTNIWVCVVLIPKYLDDKTNQTVYGCAYQEDINKLEHDFPYTSCYYCTTPNCNQGFKPSEEGFPSCDK